MLTAAIKLAPAVFIILILAAFVDLFWSINTESVMEMLKAASMSQQNA